MEYEDGIMLKEMKAYGHLKPGQKGTHRLVHGLALRWSVSGTDMMRGQGTT